MWEPNAEAWRKLAACRTVGPTIFFPTPTGTVSRRDTYPVEVQRRQASSAIDVCNGCVVRAQCLDFAIATDQRDGVWGGMIPADRRKVAKDRRQPVSA